MDLPRDEFLARAALPLDEDGELRGRDAGNACAEIPHHLTLSDHHEVHPHWPSHHHQQWCQPIGSRIPANFVACIFFSRVVRAPGTPRDESRASGESVRNYPNAEGYGSLQLPARSCTRTRTPTGAASHSDRRSARRFATGGTASPRCTNRAAKSSGGWLRRTAPDPDSRARPPGRAELGSTATSMPGNKSLMKCGPSKHGSVPACDVRPPQAIARAITAHAQRPAMPDEVEHDADVRAPVDGFLARQPESGPHECRRVPRASGVNRRRRERRRNRNQNGDDQRDDQHVHERRAGIGRSCAEAAPATVSARWSSAALPSRASAT